MTPQIPKLRFPEFKGEWELKKFGEIFTFRTTNSFSRDNLNYEYGSVRNIHYGDIHTKFKTQFNLKNELVPFINEDVNIAKIPVDNYCKVGDLVIADASEDYADIGKSIEIRNLNNEKTLAGLHTFLARPDLLEMSLGFNGFIMQSRSIRLQIMTIAQGTKVLSISTGRLSTIELNLPTLPEQTKIANFLTAIDTKIQQLTQKKALLEEYKKGLMQQLFTQQIRFKDENGEDYPDWEEKRLGEICKRMTTKNKEGNTNVLTISAQLGLVSQLDFFNKSVAGKDLTGYYLLSKNDFAYNKSYSNGYPMGAIKRLKYYENGVVSTLYICFTFFNTVDVLFMEQYFESGLHNIEIEKIAQEGARNHGLLNVGLEDFFNTGITLPSLPEQTQIANFLTAIDAKIETVAKQIAQTQAYKKGLLQQMFI